MLVNPARRENSYFPVFAKQEIEWMQTQARAGSLAVILLQDLANTNLSAQDLMGAGIIDGKRSIIIAQPRFTRLLVEAGTVYAPFSRRARNDFMLGLVHEVAHLQNPNAGNPGNPENRDKEELRVWSEVDLKVVRPLRRLDQPMNHQFIDVDDALLACTGHSDCPEVRRIIFSGGRKPH
jgi:hypothetical protein